MNSSEKFGRHQRRKTPSFSSSLLDEIYRSIDESNGCDEGADQMVVSRQTGTTKKNQSFKRNNGAEDDNEISSIRRAIMIEKWMENRSNSSPSSCRVVNSTSSSSDNSCEGGLFSSSETESNYITDRDRDRDRLSKSSSRGCFSTRTEMCEPPAASSLKHEEGRLLFMRRTKSRALKFYGDLKKVKQPISPGGRISNFLNSLFSNSTTTTTTTTTLIKDTEQQRESRSVKDSTTTITSSSSSSASPFSRSCLVKTPTCTSRGTSTTNNSTNTLKRRTVRFCPVSVIVDENSRPCGQRSVYQGDDRIAAAAIPIGRKIAESTNYTKLLKENTLVEKYNAESCNAKRVYGEKNINMNVFAVRGTFENDTNRYDDDDDDDDDDEIESCSSSDLFELENIGIGTYAEELPVYGTTNLITNHAIAKGLIL